MVWMRVAPFIGPRDIRSMTFASVQGIIQRIPRLKRLESGKPLSPAERAAEHKARAELD